MLERALTSIEKAQTAFELTMEEAANIVDGEDKLTESEEIWISYKYAVMDRYSGGQDDISVVLLHRSCS